MAILISQTGLSRRKPVCPVRAPKNGSKMPKNKLINYWDFFFDGINRFMPYRFISENKKKIKGPKVDHFTSLSLSLHFTSLHFTSTGVGGR